MTRRDELELQIMAIHREIDAAEARIDSDARRSSRWEDVQAETDRRIEGEGANLRGLRAQRDALRAELDRLPAAPPRSLPPRGSLAERMGW